ncbi:DUF7488 domain-containing protein [Campylobacter mucosalis]|uniref:DUF7488 domain-containing protein n=1 Tax=Campylobacter mucosalis TaxID=202 RepID=UPI00146FF716|nr:PDZ domain-containing protein [Campylobacter mucosalis]
MKKIVLFVCLAVFLVAEPRPTQDDFYACYLKNKSSIVSVNGNFGVAITPNLIAVPKNAKTKINDYVKFDPYLGLYLVKSSVTLEPPVKVMDETDEMQVKKSTWVGVISDSNNTVMGHIKSLGVNLGDFDTLSFESNVTGELNSACCGMLGIAIGGDKFIPNRYLKHFAAYDDVYYGDIGVVFTQNDKGFFVQSSDPIGRGKILMAGDQILAVNGETPYSLRQINEAILFAPKGSFVEFRIKRDGEEMKVYTPVSGEVAKIQSGSLDENATQVEHNQTKVDIKGLFNAIEEAVEVDDGEQLLKDYGITIDKNLYVTKVLDNTPAQEFGIQIGDKILQIERKVVKNRKDLYENLPKNGAFILLFTRNDFNFFAKVVK